MISPGTFPHKFHRRSSQGRVIRIAGILRGDLPLTVSECEELVKDVRGFHGSSLRMSAFFILTRDTCCILEALR